MNPNQASFFPKLDLNANWSKFDVEGDKPLLLDPQLGPTLITNQAPENFYTARADIYQPVYEGGRLRNTWRQARISYERARSTQEAVQNQVASQAKQAFYDLLQAQEKDRQYKNSLERLRAYDQKDRLPTIDTIRVESELASLRGGCRAGVDGLSRSATGLLCGR